MFTASTKIDKPTRANHLGDPFVICQLTDFNEVRTHCLNVKIKRTDSRRGGLKSTYSLLASNGQKRFSFSPSKLVGRTGDNS